jgi:hypothetical protein
MQVLPTAKNGNTVWSDGSICDVLTTIFPFVSIPDMNGVVCVLGTVKSCYAHVLDELLAF